MSRINHLFVFILFPLISLSQKAIIKNIYPLSKHNHSIDTIKSISCPRVLIESESLRNSVNNIIKTILFDEKGHDTTKSTQALLQEIYKKERDLKMDYKINYNKNGLLSITVNLKSSKEGKKPPYYLNFDLTTGKLFTIQDMLKSKNDSTSFWHGVIPQVTDSVRLYEQSLDRNNPKYSDIIEQLNTELANFRHNYPSHFIFTDKEIIVCFDCILPSYLLSYDHTYVVGFYYKTLKNIFKPEIIKRLL